MLIDLSNFVARATAVRANYLELLLQMLVKLRRQHPHHRFVFALEGSGTLRRQQLLRQYKAGRIPSPEFNEARRTAITMLRNIPCGFIKAPDGEADDAIASYCQQHSEDEIVIVSNDRDLWQLITPNVLIHTTVQRSTTDVDRHACRRLLGVDPEVVPLMKAMLGDPSDNIPRAIARVQQKKLLRVAQQAQQPDGIEDAVASADYLTENDKKKILSAISVVKTHMSVTRAWNNLNLKQRTHPGDAVALQEFLDPYGIKLSTDEIDSIMGAIR